MSIRADVLNDTESSSDASFQSVSKVTVASNINRRFRRQMEDAHSMIDNFAGSQTTGYFAVYDGHGGRQAVDVISNTLHNKIIQELQAQKDAKCAFENAFKSTDAELQSLLYSGSTVVAALIEQQSTGKLLTVANAGDARAVLCRNGVAARLSYDHKANDAQEAKRVVESGGFIVQDRVYGVLSVTRALGDHSMKDVVVSDPFTTVTQLEPTDSFLILACDGLWDVISDQDAVEFVLTGGKTKKELAAAAAAANLAAPASSSSTSSSSSSTTSSSSASDPSSDPSCSSTSASSDCPDSANAHSSDRPQQALPARSYRDVEAKEMVHYALELGSTDNISVMLVYF
eukprot:gnl/Hemi2/1516_TR538_c0_g1_i1.p1 gnl/Hemi2/1516_TR538_c0_g1~~gnl/Hemi2/1516_TR538_c0_g1_i1.p1  ORF type:complete len:344 (-),score=81.59 gnl/Hemi2/1516_TR538_c0_g1_i1:856-1887(-)